MGYCFMAIEKIKEKGTMTRKYEHNYRTCYVPNADQDAIGENEELVSLNGKTYKEIFDQRMEELKDTNQHIRKNAVLGLEIVTTFSREERENVDLEKWKKDQVEWLKETFNANQKYGENVASVVYHGDEAGNVHCHAFIIPIDNKGKLNASYYLNGRSKMIKLQDSYGKKMDENHNLHRGLKNSTAKHKKLKYFYTSLNQAYDKNLPLVGNVGNRNETANEYRERANEEYKKLSMLLLAEQNKVQRLKDEIKTISMNEKIEFFKEKDKVEKLENFLKKENMDIDTLIKKAKAMDKINNAIQEYPDQNKAATTFNAIQEMIKSYDNKHRKKKKKREKSFKNDKR